MLLAMETSFVHPPIVHGAAALLRGYYRHVPLRFGKRRVWNSIVRRVMDHGTGLSLIATTRFGARMHVRFPDTIQSYVYFFGVWEPAITAYLTQALGEGDTVIDVGANVGYDTLLASRLVGPAGHVHAIEASPRIFQLLNDNLALNGVANVTAHHAAACASEELVPVYLHDGDNLGGTTIVPAVAGRRAAALETLVRGRPLPAIVGEAAIRAARMIKIDVEGAEWPVVQGIAALLPSLPPQTELLIEVSAEGLHDHGVSTLAFMTLFRRAGFSAYAIGNRYNVDMYLERPTPHPEPLTGTDFEQLDILFRRE
jgi:FkbM family methyltransferase